MFPLILFVVAAAALCIIAFFIADATRWPATLHGKIHQWAAFGTFICMTTAALLQSLRLRFDPYWREQFIEATTIAASESSSSISVPFVVVLPIGAPCARTGTDAAVWR